MTSAIPGGIQKALARCCCVQACVSFWHLAEKNYKRKKKRGWDIEKLRGIYQEQSDKTKRKRSKKVTNGLYFYGTPLSGDLKTQCILQLGKTKYYKVDYNLTDKTPITKGEKSNTKNK